MKGYMNSKMLIIADRRPPLGNYISKMIEAAQNIQPGTVSHAIVLHDDWCNIYKGKACNCSPDLEIISDEEYQQRHNDNNN